MDPYIDGLPEGSRENDDAQCSVENHKEKVLIVEVSYTVCDPWTVMVHLKHTLVAKSAVMRSVRFAFHASLACPGLSVLVPLVLYFENLSHFVFLGAFGLWDFNIIRFFFVYDRPFLLFWNLARVGEDGPDGADAEDYDAPCHDY